MCRLVNGFWHDKWYDTKSNGGEFVREDAGFRGVVEKGGQFTAQSGRYHLYVLYVALACPWAHRTLIMRKLKGLEAHIDVTVVEPHMLEQGWTYSPPEPLYSLPAIYPCQNGLQRSRDRPGTLGQAQRDYRQ